MSELIPQPEDPNVGEEKFDFNHPENVLFEVLSEADDFIGPLIWDQVCIDTTTVIGPVDDVSGAASYEHSYGCGLDYMVENLILCPGPGWWVLENVTGCYTKGDGWMTDDDMDFYCGEVRPATPEEVAQA